MKIYSIIIVFCLQGIVQAQNLPGHKEVLQSMVKVNNYFMEKYADFTQPSHVGKTRPSNIWTRGVYYEGLMALFQIDPQPEYYNYALGWAEFHQWELRNGNTTRNADDQCCGQTYIDLYKIYSRPERIKNIKACMDMLVTTPQTDDWSWIDAIQMGMPVLAKLGELTGDKRYYEKMYQMYSFTRNKHGVNGLYNPEEGLWWRDADFVPPYKEPNGKNCYWSRGNGWVYAALVRVLEILPVNNPHRTEYVADFLAMSEALKNCQRTDGFWNVSLHDPVNYGGKETTGTSLFVYGMAWGINNQLLDRETYLPVVLKAWDAMVKDAVHPNGFLGWVQGTGKEPKDGQPVTYDKIPDFEDYGIGCFLLGGSEMYKLSAAKTDWYPITREAKPWTRWWWMGSAVDSANITYNLKALSRAGIGGVEITPIYGIKGQEANYIDYLSPQWMQMLAFTETEAARLGMSVDMNNGTGWPFGGPEVSVDDAATKATFKGCQLETGKTGQMVKRAAPGGQGYVLDHFNKEAVQRYLKQFDRAFAENNTPFPHSFFNDSYEVYGADWTPALLDEFERRRGYRLQTYFSELTANGTTDTSARVIADYRETVGDILKENFTQVWTDWAHSHGVITRNQAHGSPANLIDLYALVDIPECESFGITDFNIPGLRKDSIRKTNDSDPTILKYASSAAHIAGKKYTSAETFTWLTEHFRTSLSQCKPEIDLMFASGVNHVFFHGTTYSPQDAPWPGWKFYASVDMSPTNTLWRDAPAFFDYIARVQSFLQSGQPDNDFLLYLPIYDIWHETRGNYYLPFAIHGMRERLPEFCGAVDQIMSCGFDLDYISDRFLQTCTVENGRLRTEGGSLYKALILPSVKKLPLETLSKIHALARQGATIVFAGQYPDDVPGLSRLNERRKAFTGIMEQLRNEPTVTQTGDLLSLQAGFSPFKESFITDFGGKMIRRKHQAGHIYFFAMLKNNPVNNWVALGTHAESAVFFDPMTGKRGKALVRNNNGTSEVYLQLQPGQSILLKTFTNKDIVMEDWVYCQPTGKEQYLNAGWTMRFIESEPAVKETFHLPALVSWTELANDTLKRNMGTALYTTRFHFTKEKDREYRLCLGDVRESALVRVNGQKVGVLFAVPFEINIGQWLKDGENTIEVEVTNLPANRIADYDRRGVEWRIFHEINFVSITYKDTRFNAWTPLPSGLLGTVVIKEMKCFTLCATIFSPNVQTQELFPDGTPIPEWFYQNEPTDINALGTHFRITDHGVANDSTAIQTEKIQAVIDKAHQAGGGVVIIPKGTFLSGSLFFKPNTHLHLEEDGVLKGSDDISNFPIVMTRIEGQTLKYFAALVNADGLDRFTISGNGTINGNGLRYWKAFWLRREFNPQCTNMDEMRPRLVYVSNSKNIRLSGVTLMNSPFWTTHFYKCENVKLLNLHILSPEKPVKAPSTDAVDIDACTNVHIKNCFMSVNDDAVALKGGKGPTADKDENNGGNRNIIIEDCTYGFCHSALTCGSESIHNRNIIFRRCTIDQAQRLFWLKMRPDTPQNYEYIRVEEITGNATNFIYIQPWTQFFDLKGHPKPLLSYASHITMRNIKLDCSIVFNVKNSEQYKLSDFTFENLDIKASENPEIHADYIHNFTLKNVSINGNKFNN